MEPRDVFISHVEEDWPTARALAEALGAQQLTVWTYEEDGVPGISHLEQSSRAIESCRAFVLLASRKSVKAHQVIREVEEAHETQKVIIAVRLGLSHQEFVASNRILRMACGTAVTLAADEANLPNVAKRIATALRGTHQSDSPTSEARHEAQTPHTIINIAAPFGPTRPRVIEQTEASYEHAVTSANVPHGGVLGTPSTFVTSSLPQVRNQWLRFFIWLGIAIQIAFGGLMTVGYMGDMLLSPERVNWLTLTAAIAMFLCGLLLARSFLRLWRSVGAKVMPPVNPLWQLLMWTITSGIVFSAAAAYDDKYGALQVFGITFVPTFLSVALIWNGLRRLQKATATMS